jgi:hypothetical protein
MGTAIQITAVDRTGERFGWYRTDMGTLSGHCGVRNGKKL